MYCSPKKYWSSHVLQGHRRFYAFKPGWLSFCVCIVEAGDPYGPVVQLAKLNNIHTQTFILRKLWKYIPRNCFNIFLLWSLTPVCLSMY